MATRYLATLEGVEHELEVEQLESNSLRLKFGGETFAIDIHRMGSDSFSVLINDRSFSLNVAREGDELIVASSGGAARVTLIDTARRGRSANGTARAQIAGRAELRAMMPGRVVNVLVNTGDAVAFQQGVVVVEAMKMENELKSPKAGKIVEIKVTPGQTVEKGETLVVIE